MTELSKEKLNQIEDIIIERYGELHYFNVRGYYTLQDNLLVPNSETKGNFIRLEILGHDYVKFLVLQERPVLVNSLLGIDFRLFFFAEGN